LIGTDFEKNNYCYYKGDAKNDWVWEMDFKKEKFMD
jgi:hypothetical protein